VPSVRIGTSGWVYPHWRGVIYPEGSSERDWLRRYSEEFEAVEVNSSFYRLPSRAVFSAWKTSTPRDFVFAVKVSRFLTHRKKLKDPDEPVARFRDRVAGLGRKRGPWLFQLPPRWRPNVERLATLLRKRRPSETWVLEFREPAWHSEPVFELLERSGVAFCIHDLVPDCPLRTTARVVYLRFHGVTGLNGRYGATRLRPWSRRIENWLSEGLDVHAYFNNDVAGHAVRDARKLKELLGV